MKLSEDKTYQRLLMLFIPTAYLLIGNMLAVFSVGFPFRDWLRLILAAVGGTVMLWIIYNFKIPAKSSLYPLLFFAAFSIPPTLLKFLSFASVPYTILQLGDSLLWIGVYSSAYYIGYKYKDAIFETRWLAVLIPVLAVLFIGVKRFSNNRGIPLLSTAYYPLFLMPFVFLIKNRVVAFAIGFCAFSTILLSVKRAGFIAFIFAVAVYLMVEFMVEGKKITKHQIKLLIGVVIISTVFIVLFQKITAKGSIGMVDKLILLKDDGGSGRTEVWRYTGNMICSSDLLSIIFGHGYNAVSWDAVSGKSAHTDFLEVVYDFGIVGAILYGCFLFRLWEGYRSIRLKRPELAAPLASSFAIALCISAFSHILINPAYFVILSIFWGLIMGQQERESLAWR